MIDRFSKPRAFLYESASLIDAVLIRVPSWFGKAVGHPENCEAPLDIGYAAAVAQRRGYRVNVLDGETGAFFLEDFHRYFQHHPPRLVVLNGITPSVPAMFELARSVRRYAPETKVLAIGQHADAMPETFLFEDSPFDFTLEGEYDEAVADLLGFLDSGGDGSLPLGIRRYRNGAVDFGGSRPWLKDLDALPFPMHRYWLNRRYRYLHPMNKTGRYRWGFVQTSRGCPQRCLYCSRALRTTFGASMRFRSPESVVEEMRFLRSEGVNVLVFTDDAFSFNRARTLALCEEISRADLKISWTAQCRVAPADLELFRAMRRAGCSTVSFGVESGSERILEVLQKDIRVEQTRDAFRLAREAGLRTVGFFMVGNPGETPEDFEQTRRLLLELDPDILQVAFFTAYPGSESFQRYRDRLPGDWRKFRHYESLVNMSAVSDETVQSWQKELYKALLLRPRYILRYVTSKHVNLLLNLDTEAFLATYAFNFLFRRS